MRKLTRAHVPALSMRRLRPMSSLSGLNYGLRGCVVGGQLRVLEMCMCLSFVCVGESVDVVAVFPNIPVR